MFLRLPSVLAVLAALTACSTYQGGPSFGTGYAPGVSAGYPSPYGYGGWSSPYGYGYNNGDRFSPKKGLTCDRTRHVCYDRYGVDYYATREYLGSKSAKYGLKRYGEQAFIFAPQQGVVCDRRSQSCSDGNGLNASLTRKYFSKNDTRRVAGWSSADMFSPQAGVACNRTAQVCSDNGGPNVDLTQLYFGRQAAVNLANQQSQPALPAPSASQAVEPVAAPLPVEVPSGAVGAVVPQEPSVEPVPAGGDAPAEQLPLPEPIGEPVPAPAPVVMPEPAAASDPMPVSAPIPEPAPIPAPEPSPVPNAAPCEGEACPQ